MGFKLYILVERLTDSRCKVSTCLSVPLKDFVNDMEMDLTDRDISTVKKIVDQFNKSKFGSKIQVLFKVK